MILHSHNPANATAPVMQWWAVHAETLTAVHITLRGGKSAPTAALTLVPPSHPPAPSELYRSHPTRHDSTTEIARDVIADLRRNYFLATRRGSLTTATPAGANLPEYLLLFQPNGTPHGIFHTAFPPVIFAVNPADDSTIGQPSHWIVPENLSPYGWAYYYEGCQQALDELGPAFIAAAAAEAQA